MQSHPTVDETASDIIKALDKTDINKSDETASEKT